MFRQFSRAATSQRTYCPQRHDVLVTSGAPRTAAVWCALLCVRACGGADWCLQSDAMIDSPLQDSSQGGAGFGVVATMIRHNAAMLAALEPDGDLPLVIDIAVDSTAPSPTLVLDASGRMQEGVRQRRHHFGPIFRSLPPKRKTTTTVTVLKGLVYTTLLVGNENKNNKSLMLRAVRRSFCSAASELGPTSGRRDQSVDAVTGVGRAVGTVPSRAGRELDQAGARGPSVREGRRGAAHRVGGHVRQRPFTSFDAIFGPF